MTNLMEAYDNELLNRGWTKGLLAGREEGLLAGREEGREEGLLAGREEGVFITACNLLKLGIPLSSISIATGFSEERLRKIAADIDKGINKSQLCKQAKISTNAMAKLGKNEDVGVEVLTKFVGN